MVHQLFLYVWVSLFQIQLQTSPTGGASSCLRIELDIRNLQMACKNKGVSRSFFGCSLGCCQRFIDVCYLMWFMQTGPDLVSNTSLCNSNRNDWKGTWKSRAHSGSQWTPSVQYRSTSLCQGRTTKPPRLLTVNVEFKCYLKLLADG